MRDTMQPTWTRIPCHNLDASIYRQDWTCHHASRHPDGQPFIPCQDCHRPTYSPDQGTDVARQPEPAPYMIGRLYAGQPFPQVWRAGRHGEPDTWTTDTSTGTTCWGTPDEIRQAFGPDVILIPANR